MARKGHGRPVNLVQIAGSGTTYPDDGSSPVGSNEWNANRDTTGILGVTKKTEAISSANTINVTDSYIEITTADSASGGSNDGIRTLAAVTTALSTDYYPSDTSTKSYVEGDFLYVVKAAGQATTSLVHQGGGAGAGKITTLTGENKELSATVPTILIARTIGANVEWVEYGGGAVADLSITTAKLAADAITGAKLADNAVDSEHYTDGSIDLVHLSANSVDSTQYVDGSIDTAHIGDNQVTGAKIAMGSDAAGDILYHNGTDYIRLAKGSANEVLQINSGATAPEWATVTATEIAANAVGSSELADDAVDTDAIADDAVTAAKIGDDIINSEHYAAGSIDNEHLADDAVGVAELSATGTASSSTFLRGDNAWTAVSSYATPTIGSTPVPSGTTQATIAGLTLTSPVFNTGVSGSAVIDSDTMSGASATTVSSSESIKAYVDSSVAANITLKGTYNASTDDPSLDDGSPIAGIVAGDHYIVSVAGTFFSEVLQVGDSLIAKIDSPTTFAHWITVNSNIVTPIVGANIADDAIDSDHYAAGSIDTAHIANLQVTTALIAADAINGDKIADDAIGAEHIAANAVVQASLADDAVGAAELASDAVVTASIVDLNVTTAKIAADAITSAKIADDQIDSEHYATGSIDSAHIANDQIDSQHYADGSIDNAHIADDQIDSEHYAAGSIDTAHIADDQITLAKMAGGTAGNVITYDASGNPAAVVTGTAGQILTSAGSGQPPTFATASGSWVGTATSDLNMAGTADAAKGDIIDVNRLTLNIKGHTFDADSTNNADISGESQLYVRQLKLASGAVDSNNDGLFVRLKKNGSNVYLQLA